MTQEIIDTYGERVIRGDELLVMLRRVETGEHPNIVFADMWASLPHVAEERRMYNFLEDDDAGSAG